MSRFPRLKTSVAVTLVLAALPLAGGLADEPSQTKGVDYNRQIRAILANNCLACHGFDAAERKGELRLDVRESAIGAAESGEHAIVPGQPEKSELISRIHSTDDDLRM